MRQGTLTRWYAAATDIDDRKQAEQRLHNENVACRRNRFGVHVRENCRSGRPSLQTVLTRVSKVAPFPTPSVLIHRAEEPGTGPRGIW